MAGLSIPSNGTFIHHLWDGKQPDKWRYGATGCSVPDEKREVEVSNSSRLLMHPHLLWVLTSVKFFLLLFWGENQYWTYLYNCTHESFGLGYWPNDLLLPHFGNWTMTTYPVPSSTTATDPVLSFWFIYSWNTRPTYCQLTHGSISPNSQALLKLV